MHRPPTQGVKAAKPRMPKTEANGEPANKEEVARLNREYLRTRNSQMASKAAVAEMELGRRRGELISKELAFAQLSYLLVCFRQRTLLAPKTIARRLLTLGLIEEVKEHDISQAIQTEVHALLTELANLPEKVTDPDWLQTLQQKEAGETPSPERRQGPDEIKAEQARTVRRREKKTETMKKARERGGASV